MQMTLGFLITGATLYLSYRIFYWWFFYGYPEIRRDFEQFEQERQVKRIADTSIPSPTIKSGKENP